MVAPAPKVAVRAFVLYLVGVAALRVAGGDTMFTWLSPGRRNFDYGKGSDYEYGKGSDYEYGKGSDYGYDK